MNRSMNKKSLGSLWQNKNTLKPKSTALIGNIKIQRHLLKILVDQIKKDDTEEVMVLQAGSTEQRTVTFWGSNSLLISPRKIKNLTNRR